MNQKLNASQLRDITSVLFFTRMKHKNIVLKNTFVLGYTLVGMFVFWLLGVSLVKSATPASLFLLVLSFVCLIVVIYIFVCRFLEKSRCKKMVKEKVKDEFEVKFKKEYLVYDGQTIPFKRFKEIFLYHNVYYFVENDQLIVVQKCKELDKVLEHNYSVKIHKKDTLFCLM